MGWPFDGWLTRLADYEAADKAVQAATDADRPLREWDRAESLERLHAYRHHLGRAFLLLARFCQHEFPAEFVGLLGVPELEQLRYENRKLRKQLADLKAVRA